MTLLCSERLSIGFRRYEGLTRQRELWVMDAIDFTIDRGEILALVGSSGAGKSLLAHAVFGILPPNAVTSGRLSFEGKPLDSKARSILSGRRMALVPQSISHLNPMVRCDRQLAWAAKRGGCPTDVAMLNLVLDRFGLDRWVLRAFPHQLSGGMARRMLLAIATIGEPDLIVADEPTSGLDTENTALVLEHLRSLADSGSGVLLITHSLADALPFADRVALLKDGRIVGIEQADCFADEGEGLASPFARALWSALPQNNFYDAAHVDA